MDTFYVKPIPGLDLAESCLAEEVSQDKFLARCWPFVEMAVVLYVWPPFAWVAAGCWPSFVVRREAGSRDRS